MVTAFAPSGESFPCFAVPWFTALIWGIQGLRAGDVLRGRAQKSSQHPHCEPYTKESFSAVLPAVLPAVTQVGPVGPLASFTQLLLKDPKIQRLPPGIATVWLPATFYWGGSGSCLFFFSLI